MPEPHDDAALSADLPLEPAIESTRARKISWVLYDWANSGYGLIIIGPVFPPYFIKTLLPQWPDDRSGIELFGTFLPGSAVMGLLTSISMALMAIGAPVLGAIADIRGLTRRMLIGFGVAGALLTMAMVFLQPGDWVWGALLYIASNFCFGTSFAFYNAYLPTLAPPSRQGSLSGWGFAAGYIGGAVALILVLMLILRNPEWVRWGLFLSGVWWLVFALPAYLILPELPRQSTPADKGSLIGAGFRRIVHTLRNIRGYGMLFLFLLAFLLYNDGVETVIAMSSSFGTDYLKMSKGELIIVFLIVQFVAFIGAMVFGYLSDRIGNKKVIVINLVVWVIAGLLAFMLSPGRPVTVWGHATTSGAVEFALLGILIGAVLGGVQASSRALMAQLAPPVIRNEAFGFFSISGKFASIFGPLLYAGLVWWQGPRWGMISVLPFLIAGLIVLLKVREPKAASQA